MDDKKVGIIWGARHTLPGVVTDLIRKLVEELTEVYDDDLGYILDRFGIDPATWPDKD